MPYFICNKCFGHKREYFLEYMLCPTCDDPLTLLSQEISSTPQGLTRSTSLLTLTKLKLRSMTFSPDGHGGLTLISDRGSYHHEIPSTGGHFSSCIPFNDVVALVENLGGLRVFKGPDNQTHVLPPLPQSTQINHPSGRKSVVSITIDSKSQFLYLRPTLRMAFLFNITCQDPSEYLHILPAPIYHNIFQGVLILFYDEVTPSFSALLPAEKKLSDYVPILQCAPETTFPELTEVPVCIRLQNKLGTPLEKFNVITQCRGEKISARTEFCKIAEICFASLAALHRKGILHWDIHGDNILMQKQLSGPCRAIFIDFEKSWIITELNPNRETGNVIYNYALYIMGCIDGGLWLQVISRPPFSIPLSYLTLPQEDLTGFFYALERIVLLLQLYCNFYVSAAQSDMPDDFYINDGFKNSIIQNLIRICIDTRNEAVKRFCTRVMDRSNNPNPKFKVVITQLDTELRRERQQAAAQAARAR